MKIVTKIVSQENTYTKYFTLHEFQVYSFNYHGYARKKSYLPITAILELPYLEIESISDSEIQPAPTSKHHNVHPPFALPTGNPLSI